LLRFGQFNYQLLRPWRPLLQWNNIFTFSTLHFTYISLGQNLMFLAKISQRSISGPYSLNAPNIAPDSKVRFDLFVLLMIRNKEVWMHYNPNSMMTLKISRKTVLLVEKLLKQQEQERTHTHTNTHTDSISHLNLQGKECGLGMKL
jgi:hypothetical protein